jgi:hypothetical protein
MVIVSILIMTTALVITEHIIALTNTFMSNHHRIFPMKTKNIHLRKINGRIRNGYASLMHISVRNRQPTQLPFYPR